MQDDPPPNVLRDAVLRLRADVDRRINQVQGGVPTFFDGFLLQLIDQVASTGAVHHWSCRPAPTPAAGTEAANLALVLQWLADFLRRHAHERLVAYAARRGVHPRGACDIGSIDLVMSQGIAGCLAWRNRPLFKTVYDFALVPMLVHELKPASILEIGSGAGASALWMADLCAMDELSTKIYSVDIRRVVTGDHAAVTFYEGDANDPASLFPVDLLRSARHPWLVIEDAHVNVPGVLKYFDGFLRRGDYLIVEDSRDKHDALGAWVTDRYRVDSRYTDFFGRNATSAEDAIFAVIA